MQPQQEGSESETRKLPSEVAALLKELGAPPRLVAHLTLVHDAAHQITERINELWPALQYDKEAVLIGAATHDIGKVVHRNELVEPGHLHEEIGPSLLIEHGFTDNYARFARTHGQWEQMADIEDMLVALADKLWKGARDQRLEGMIVQFISVSCKEDT